MTTPTTSDIQHRALKLYMGEQEQSFSGVSMPEIDELKECGVWDQAKMELMSGDFKQDEAMVDSVFAELDHVKQTVAENNRLKEKLKEFKRKLGQKTFVEYKAVPVTVEPEPIVSKPELVCEPKRKIKLHLHWSHDRLKDGGCITPTPAEPIERKTWVLIFTRYKNTNTLVCYTRQYAENLGAILQRQGYHAEILGEEVNVTG